MDIAMTVNPKDKMVTCRRKIEKWVLRKALKIFFRNLLSGDRKNSFQMELVIHGSIL
jgi:hypothetical protein